VGESGIAATPGGCPVVDLPQRADGAVLDPRHHLVHGSVAVQGMKCVETPFARTVSITSFASFNRLRWACARSRACPLDGRQADDAVEMVRRHDLDGVQSCSFANSSRKSAVRGASFV